MKNRTYNSLLNSTDLFSMLGFILPTLAFGQLEDAGQYFNCTAPFDVQIEINQPKCFGDQYGSIAMVIIGGNPFDQGDNFDNDPYLIDWNKNAFDGNSILEYVPVGQYEVTITDQSGCLFMISFAISEPSEMVIAGSITHALNNQNGAIDLEVNGGVGNYSYIWENGSHLQDQSNLESGTYSVTVYDGNNCSKSGIFNVGNSRSIQNFTNSYSFQPAAWSRIQDENITLYPNPTEDQVTITWNDPIISQVIVRNTLGTVTNSIAVTGQKQLSIKEFDPGIHRISFLDALNNEIAIKKLIVI